MKTIKIEDDTMLLEMERALKNLEDPEETIKALAQITMRLQDDAINRLSAKIAEALEKKGGK